MRVLACPGSDHVCLHNHYILFLTIPYPTIHFCDSHFVVVHDTPAISHVCELKKQAIALVNMSTMLWRAQKCVVGDMLQQ